jgi:hypothetical protein
LQARAKDITMRVVFDADGGIPGSVAVDETDLIR